jgi:lysophospholipase L1-like esterase
MGCAFDLAPSGRVRDASDPDAKAVSASSVPSRRAPLTIVRCLRPAVAGLLAAALAGTAAPASAGGERSLYLDGDSLAVGAGLFLRGFLPGWEIAAATGVSRHVSEGASAVRGRGTRLERVLVLSLGTNDDPRAVSRFAGHVLEVLRAAGEHRCVIWTTIARPPYRGVSWDGYNEALRQLARRRTNLRLFDWAAIARAHPGWFGPDGVHPAPAGYRALAAALARLIRAC